MSSDLSGAVKTAPPRRGPTRVPRTPRLDLTATGSEARRWAAMILEVLAGVRTPLQAAEALGASLPRYYALELRALQGMLAACAPRPRGPTRTPAREIAALQRECEQLRRECARQQALVRVAQRTLGVAPPSPTAKAEGPGKKPRRRRRPVSRALPLAQQLRATLSGTEPEARPSDKGVSP